MKDLEIEEENDDNEQALIVNNPEIENIFTYLVVRPHSKNPNKICEVGLTEGLTKAFESRIMLAISKHLDTFTIHYMIQL